ncbi:MAG TPA: hypothetical protein VFR81_09310, partial [Longimicrobium sp.]|nr:hypothetical protein [Longimicrobium sp.]
PSCPMNFPLQLRFKIMAVSPQISVTDAAGGLLLYVKQKAFKLKEAVTVFADEAQTRPMYRIAADRVLDISASYTITNESGQPLGALQRKGMRSIWRAHYEVHRGGGPVLVIREEKPWVKVMDALLGEIPVLGMFTGFFFHPAYVVTRADNGELVMRIVKQPAMFEGKYALEKIGTSLRPEDETLAVLNLLMMLLLERRRG